MKFKREHFCCSPRLLREIEEIREVEAAIGEVVWTDHFTVEVNGRTYEHQSGYNRALAAGLHKFGWTMQPKLTGPPRLPLSSRQSDGRPGRNASSTTLRRWRSAHRSPRSTATGALRWPMVRGNDRGLA